MREPQRVVVERDMQLRITPACAGTTYRHRSMLQMRRDHPRVCGNHSILFQIRFHSEGSPPRVREPLSGYVPMLSEIGITPACAGTTIVRAARARKPRDHPRVCGNHLEIHLAGDLCLGSPPRVREPLAVYLNYLIVFGITPACAGTTRGHSDHTQSGWDHPRVCGNHRAITNSRYPEPGSPPRVREPQSW